MDEELIKKVEEAIRLYKLIPPRQRFQAMADRGAIDKDGNVLLRRPTEADRKREMMED